MMRWRHWWQPALARACLAEGDVEEACRVASEALHGAVGVETNVQMVIGFQRELASSRYRDEPAARLFREQVRRAAISTR
jgi:hypothetical protein